MPSALVVAWHCEDDTETITGWLDVCKVRWRPGEIGVSRDELRKSLESAPTCMSDATRPCSLTQTAEGRLLFRPPFTRYW